MFIRATALCIVVVVLSNLGAQEGKFSVKPGSAPVPQELAADVQKLLGKGSIQLFDEGGKAVGEFWFRSEIPADATAEQIKNGITWREVKQTEVVGAVRFDQDWTDYRKQKVKAGVYTLRLGYQPSDGDHQGSSEFQDFLVLVAADKDKKPELLDVKHMVELSGASIAATHPAVLMLAPNAKGTGPAIISLPRSHWVIQTKSEIAVAGKKTGKDMGIGLNVVGHAE